MEIEFNLQLITTHVQQALLLFVGMALIALVKAGEEHALIMVEWQDGIDIIDGKYSTVRLL